MTSQGTRLTVILIVSFIVFLTMKGSLKLYIDMLRQKK